MHDPPGEEGTRLQLSFYLPKGVCGIGYSRTFGGGVNVESPWTRL
jgi:hypothetical protein